MQVALVAHPLFYLLRAGPPTAQPTFSSARMRVLPHYPCFLAIEPKTPPSRQLIVRLPHNGAIYKNINIHGCAAELSRCTKNASGGHTRGPTDRATNGPRVRRRRAASVNCSKHASGATRANLADRQRIYKKSAAIIVTEMPSLHPAHTVRAPLQPNDE
jgi:hypothetical protein